MQPESALPWARRCRLGGTRSIGRTASRSRKFPLRPVLPVRSGTARTETPGIPGGRGARRTPMSAEGLNAGADDPAASAPTSGRSPRQFCPGSTGCADRLGRPARLGLRRVADVGCECVVCGSLRFLMVRGGTCMRPGSSKNPSMGVQPLPVDAVAPTEGAWMDPVRVAHIGAHRGGTHPAVRRVNPHVHPVCLGQVLPMPRRVELFVGPP